MDTVAGQTIYPDLLFDCICRAIHQDQPPSSQTQFPGTLSHKIVHDVRENVGAQGFSQHVWQNSREIDTNAR